jgi:hypothetical protein
MVSLPNNIVKERGFDPEIENRLLEMRIDADLFLKDRLRLSEGAHVVLHKSLHILALDPH